MKSIAKFLLVFSLFFFLFLSANFAQKEISNTKSEVAGESLALFSGQSEAQVSLEQPFSNVQYPPISPRGQGQHSYDYCGMVAGDFDGDGIQEIAFDYQSLGIWIYDPNAISQWNQISTDDPLFMISTGIGSPTTDKLIIQWAWGAGLSWWKFNGYPGDWTLISTTYISMAYNAGDIGDGDSGHEVVISIWNDGTYVLDYTGTGFYGGFEIHKIIDNPAGYNYGQAIDIDGDSDYELIHAFGYIGGWQFWNYTPGYPVTWSQIYSGTCYSPTIACDVDGGADEFIAYLPVGTFMYKHGSPGTWTRINFDQPQQNWPVGFTSLGNLYEVVYLTSSGLWLWDFYPSNTWTRINWNNPQFCLGANVAAIANGGNAGEELIGDFDTLGVWIMLNLPEDTGGVPVWDRLNWNNPEAMIPANIDADPETEIVFSFGTLGVWIWDQATGAWTRINWNPPASK